MSNQATIEALERRIVAQERTIATLLDAAERRLALDSYSTCVDLLHSKALERVVSDHTARLESNRLLLRRILDALDSTLCIVDGGGRIIETNRVSGGPTLRALADRVTFRLGEDYLAACRGVDGNWGSVTGRIAEAVESVLRGMKTKSTSSIHAKRSTVRHVDSRSRYRRSRWPTAEARFFIDDDANVLRGLRRMLRPMRHEIAMEFARASCSPTKCSVSSSRPSATTSPSSPFGSAR